MSTSQHSLALNNKPNIEEKKKTNKGEIHNGVMNPLYPTNYKPAFFVVASAATFLSEAYFSCQQGLLTTRFAKNRELFWLPAPRKVSVFFGNRVLI